MEEVPTSPCNVWREGRMSWAGPVLRSEQQGMGPSSLWGAESQGAEGKGGQEQLTLPGVHLGKTYLVWGG